MKGDLPANWAETRANYIKEVDAAVAKLATRQSSQKAIEAYAPVLPELLGGSADLTPSNLTNWSGTKVISGDDAGGNYISYGVREFGMSAIMNGIALHGGFIPYGATFLMFMEYARNAIRMAALMKQRSLFVYTHDSIGLGEDGPTHQPVEQIASLRLTPNLATWRPCDAVESAVAWAEAIEADSMPSALIFSRQGLPHMQRDEATIANIARGGYVLSDCEAEEPQLILIATGSEVELAMNAASVLREKGVQVRIVSMPCTNVFDAQDVEYRESVLPSQVGNRIASKLALLTSGTSMLVWKVVLLA